MGVTGLWPIVHPCARPIKLETLNRKRLAVDASIWIYQFLKAVRDKEGNALRNSHVVGFFRRICKLLFFGIKPVFVFDGGAPALKRQTILGRKRRREGRREDAVRTAGRLLAVQMHRAGEEEEERRKRERASGRERERPAVEEEALPEGGLVYVDELGMSAQERTASRKFTKKDAYHLPNLDVSIESMGQPDDPRIMSTEELEEYARQFNSGEDINLYDFSKIDFNGPFFLSLPAGDRYNILNAARLRSRLRMGHSKEQLDAMFPDRMAFSRFQIERVAERNDLTQRLMNLNGMNGEDAMYGGSGRGRIAGEKDREYVLVKNDGVEGGWALGVVSTDRGAGDRNKPIDVEALGHRVREEETDEEEDDFEDVPIEGLNRLPKLSDKRAPQNYNESNETREAADARRKFYASRRDNKSLPTRSPPPADSNPLFVASDDGPPASRATNGLFEEDDEYDDEEADLNRAIAMSLQNQHGQSEDEDESAVFEDVMPPQYEQKRAAEAMPITKSSGRMVAHIVNNRANAAIPKRRRNSNSSDEDMDLQSALAASRKQASIPAAIKTVSTSRRGPAPVTSNTKNLFDGPLPFEKLDFGKSLFGKNTPKSLPDKDAPAENEDAEMAGGFEREDSQAPKPLPPWLVGNADIRSDVREQQERDLELDAEDRARAKEEERVFRRDHGIIELESSDEDEDAVQILDGPPPVKKRERNPIFLDDDDVVSLNEAENTTSVQQVTTEDLADDVRAVPPVSHIPQHLQPAKEPQVQDASHVESDEEPIDWSESEPEDALRTNKIVMLDEAAAPRSEAASAEAKSPSPMFEDVPMETSQTKPTDVNVGLEKSPSPVFEDVSLPAAIPEVAALPSTSVIIPSLPTATTYDRAPVDEEVLSDIDFDEFSDPEEEALLTQLAQEAEEHARFASTLNHKTPEENAAAYEAELKSLRAQQKKDRRDADEVSHIMVTECQALLRLFGLPYITAPMEAEAQCAELVDLGLVDGIVTDDSDIFLFGGTRVYKNMFNSNKFVECYLTSDLEKELSLSRDALIRIAHLLGSDYTEGLPSVGPVTALEILSEFPSPTGLSDFKAWWSTVQSTPPPKRGDPKPVESSFRRKFRRNATKLFLPPGFPSSAVTEAYLKPDVDRTPEPFQWGVPDLDGLRAYLMATIGWDQERTDEVLVPVIRDLNRREREGTQSNITRFFEGAVGAGASGVAKGEGFAGRQREVGSRRMREAVEKLKASKGGIVGGALGGTFGDEAADWAKKDERERRKAARKPKGKREKGKGLRKDVEMDENNAVAEERASGEDEDDAGSEAEYVEPATKGRARKRVRV